MDHPHVRVLGNDGLCTIGWEVSQVNYQPLQVKTFNMYTCQFGKLALPLQNLPRGVENSARAVWKDDGPLVLQFSPDKFGIGRCANTISDDDFEIIFGDYGYVVWCFDEDIELPIAGSRMDESMEVAPVAPSLPLNQGPSPSRP